MIAASHARRLALVAALALPGLADVAGAQDFTWNGSVGRGNWVRMRNLNGAVRVEQGTGDRVEVTATKRPSRGGDTSVVKIVATQAASGGDVVICALWDEGGMCSADEYRATRGNNGWNSDDDRRNVSVEFRVRLPAGVRLDASTVNGAVSIEGATSEVRANTVNGSVRAVSTGGPVHAKTVNGSIDVSMSALGGTESLQYETVNGSVKVRLPEGVNADVELSTVNGSLTSDFPLTMQGTISRRNIKARLGSGGRRMTFSTVNGSVQLMKQ